MGDKKCLNRRLVLKLVMKIVFVFVCVDMEWVGHGPVEVICYVVYGK